MSKTSEYQEVISEHLKEGRFEELKRFIKENSNLPGPRGNLEMAYAFGDCFDAEITDAQWTLLAALSGISADEAPTGDPAEMLPFCAALAAGSFYAHASEGRREKIRAILRAAMNDERWRMREAAAMGYQRIAEMEFAAIKQIFGALYPDSNFLEKRAFLAALAHPPILKNRDVALYSLGISEDIMKQAMAFSADELKSEGYKVLSKGLEYALSVFIAHAPEEGFEMLKAFAPCPQKHIKRIIKSNLNKARLKDRFPGKVNETEAMLNQ